MFVPSFVHTYLGNHIIQSYNVSVSKLNKIKGSFFGDLQYFSSLLQTINE